MAQAHIFQIEDGKFGLSLTDPGIADVCTATIADFSDFGDPGYCQVTSGALNASSNVSSTTVPATFCSPEQTIPSVGATSYEIGMTWLQDPDVVAGISRFFFEHDTEEAWFFFGMDGDNPPKAVGRLRLVSGTIGGTPRDTLTADVTLPVVGKPDICFGDSNTSEAVGPSSDPLNISATYPAAAASADLTTLKADATSGDTGTGAPYNGGTGTATAFTAGQYIVLGDGSQAHWDGAAWVAGAA